jgi:hypothetical protein
MRLGFLLIILFLLPPVPGHTQPGWAAGDTLMLVRLENVDVKAQRRWENDTLRYRYNQMRYYVTTILPYLNEARILFSEIDAKLHEPGLSKRERKAFIHEREDLVRSRFEDKIKELNTTQGVLLMKLIARETGLNIYEMLSDFKNPVAAMKWQAWAKLNGFNLNRKYHPEEEGQLEHIMEGLGYPLPLFY